MTKTMLLFPAFLFLFSGQERVLMRPLSLTHQPRVAPGVTGPIVVGTGTDQALLLDEFGNLTVTWYGSLATTPVNTILISRSQNYGASWSNAATLPFEGSASGDAPAGPNIAIEQNGAIDAVTLCEGGNGNVVCPGGNNIDPSLQLIRSVDGGQTWSPSVDISLPPITEGYGADEPVVMPCGGGIVVAWQDDGFDGVDEHGSAEIMLRYIAGGIPGKAIDVTANEIRPALTTVSNGHPQLAVNAQGTVFVTWVYDNGGDAPWSIMFAEVPNCGVVQ
jgi:hypothetical protein